MDTGDSSGGMTCYPIKMFDLMGEVPLGHVHKEFMKVTDSSREAFKLLKALFACEPHARAVVAVGSRRKVEDLSEEWKEHFRIAWTNGHISSGERIRSFLADKNSQVLLGTKLVTQGIDVRNLQMVIMMDYRPSIIEFIQAAGRLRSSGLFYLLSSARARGEAGERVSDHPAVPLLEDGCVDKQMAAFYGLGAQGAPTRNAELLLADSQGLVARHRRAMEKLERDQELARKRAVKVFPSLALEKKRIKRDFHEPHGYTDILLYIGLPTDMAAGLFLQGVDIHFCPPDTFTRKDGCKDCLKDYNLCVCAGGQYKSYRRIACEALALRRMLLDDERCGKHLEGMEPFRRDPVGYLHAFVKERKQLQAAVMRKYLWFHELTTGVSQIVALQSVRGVGSCRLFTRPAADIRRIYCDAWRSLKKQRLNVLEYFWSRERMRCDEIWDKETSRSSRSFVEIVDKQGTFERMWQRSSARFHGPEYVKGQYGNVHRRSMNTYEMSRARLFYKYDGSVGLPSWDMYLSMVLGMFYNVELRSRIADLVEQIGDVWLVPHWLELQNVLVQMGDGKKVPFFVLCGAIYQEMQATPG
ncbi:hypothetical protein HG536_0C06580 [Torulaspora globosa]|uniref:Helicase C-terminal domain-containing protein n=1 Tax=Torulaspora globosa TaxID=48254 RepID=A0A7G3ZG51_9SACH|nr:uncharacterized protein HG536_0C06580 [Torulaspora globosa]QLL32487.1 hypothetical protein HG536_0C06580 [Torulaspora globosa]